MAPGETRPTASDGMGACFPALTLPKAPRPRPYYRRSRCLQNSTLPPRRLYPLFARARRAHNLSASDGGR